MPNANLFRSRYGYPLLLAGCAGTVGPITNWGHAAHDLEALHPLSAGTRRRSGWLRCARIRPTSHRSIQPELESQTLSSSEADQLVPLAKLLSSRYGFLLLCGQRPGTLSPSESGLHCIQLEIGRTFYRS